MAEASAYTAELGQEITERLAKGEPLAQICRDEHMPAVRTVSHWKERDAAFMADFARAREEGHDAIAVRLRDTARGGGDSQGDVQRDKLIIDTDLKLLAKWDKRYADKIHQEVTGNLEHVVTHRLQESAQDVFDRVTGRAEVGSAEVLSSNGPVLPAD